MLFIFSIWQAFTLYDVDGAYIDDLAYVLNVSFRDPAFDEQGIKLARISLDHIFPLNFDKDDVWDVAGS